jgi:acyltransferase
MKNRNKIIDIAKGIGIILVLLGHTALPTVLLNIIYAFHMPLFFFISGYLYNRDKYSTNIYVVFKSKFSTHLWPFFTFSFFAIILNIILTLKDLNYIFLELENTILGMHNINGPIWFLTALFVVEIIFSQITRYKYYNLFVIIIIAIGFINSYYFQYRVIYNFDIALIGILFFYIGYKINNISFKDVSLLKYTILLVFSMVGTIYMSYNVEFNMLYHMYNNIYDFIISAFLGIISIFIISKIISIVNIFKLKEIFIWLGSNSLIILATHLVYANLINEIIGKLPLRLHNLIAILLIGFSIYIINKYFNWMLKFSELYNTPTNQDNKTRVLISNKLN